MDLNLVNTLSTAQQSQTLNQVQTTVAGLALNAQRAQGAAAVQLIKAASPGQASPGDALAAAATGLGGHMDAYA